MTITAETTPQPAQSLMAAEPMSQPTTPAVEPPRFPAIPAYRQPKRESHRLLPSCEDAERGLLSLLMASPDRTGAICSSRKLLAENLHSPIHREI